MFTSEPKAASWTSVPLSSQKQFVISFLVRKYRENQNKIGNEQKCHLWWLTSMTPAVGRPRQEELEFEANSEPWATE